ncbi:MAG: hypothetical protein ABI721_01025 [Candidatus Dojkabacteria bacterium]
MKAMYRTNILLLVSFILAFAMMFFGGFKEKETPEIITMVVTISVTMAGFGLIAFQIARVSNELKNDFIESSILMILSTMAGFIYLVYPAENNPGIINFGEVSIFIFFWAFNLFLITLIDKRLHILD